MRNCLRETIVLYLHERFIVRYLRNNGYILSDGACVYCKDSTKMFLLLDKIRLRIARNLLLCPFAGTIDAEDWEKHL